MRVYNTKNVYHALQDRLDMIFNRFENVIVSASGGKDSTVLWHAVTKKAQELNRTVNMFFLDQEAEYASTIDQIKWQSKHPNINVLWYQVPIYMTNATSYEKEFLYAWGKGEHWMREKEDVAIKEAPGAPDRFYPFVEWFENKYGKDTAILIGLRTEESLNRYRAVIKKPAIKDITWSTKTKNGAVKLYPIYDFSFEDIWTYLGKLNVRYNKIYDYMWIKGTRIPGFRVSNLIHKKAFSCLTTLQEFEPGTYDKLVKRIKGVHVAALYAKEKSIFKTRERPEAFKSWLDYRDFLLDTITSERKERFADRFSKQANNERVFRQQCKQLLLNDWENRIPVVNTEKETNPLTKWIDIL